MRLFRKPLFWLYPTLFYATACTVYTTGMLVMWSLSALIRAGLGL